jgi:hypothetical protein
MSDGLSGNKGEWSEMYAFLKILAEGRIYGADGDLNALKDVYYDVNRIIRDEGDGPLEYALTEDGCYAEILSGGRPLVRVYREKIAEESEYLLDAIVSSKGRAFHIDRTEEFMREMHCRKIKAPSSDKSDILLEIHDHRTGMDPTLGFSIKSTLGHPSTLLNAGKTTNFVFRLEGNVTNEIIETVNGTLNLETAEKKKTKKLSARYAALSKAGIKLVFVGADNEILENNLILIDSALPSIVAEMLKLHYIENISRLKEQVAVLNYRNPLGYKSIGEYPHYEYKIKKLLTASALGMTPATPWTGKEQASGGYLIIRKDGEVLCYHLYNRNDFEDYLLRNTRLETPSSTRYEFSEIYRGADGEYYLKLNLQIRFL